MTVPASQFEFIAAAQGAFKPEEIDGLKKFCDAHAGEGVLTGGVADDYRRSSVAWLPQDEEWQWLHERIVKVAQGFNQRFFGLELQGFGEKLQVARYDADREGAYDWHVDFGLKQQTRKLSISIQLSASDEYEGGDLEFDLGTEITKVGREQGLAVAFPSFVRHRVAPVTRGTRYSLVAWIHGPRFR